MDQDQDQGRDQYQGRGRPTRFISVIFGPAHAGKTTVGYTTPDGERVTTGVVEVTAFPGKGGYYAPAWFDNAYSGPILWDTGGDDPTYKVEHVSGLPSTRRAAEPIPVPTGARPDAPRTVTFLVRADGPY